MLRFYFSLELSIDSCGRSVIIFLFSAEKRDFSVPIIVLLKHVKVPEEELVLWYRRRKIFKKSSDLKLFDEKF